MATITVPDYVIGATPASVWAVLQEITEKQEKFDQQMKASQEKFDQQMKESQEKAERQMQEIRESHKETERIVARNSRQMGGLHNSLGDLVEHLVVPGTAKRFNEIGFHFTDVSPGGRKFFDEQGKVKTQVDILLENGESVMAVEVKTKWHKKDIERHLRRLEILREIKDKAGDKRKIYGAIALAMGGELEKEAVLEAGLYLLEQSGDTMQINLPDGFVPREW
jgi:hypothetical protein